MRKRENHAYEILALLPFPVESFGPCHHAKRCGNWEAVLGDNLCVNCWDLRYNNRTRAKLCEIGDSDTWASDMSNFDNLIQHLEDQCSDEYDRG